MANVYRAVQPSIGRKVAIKVLPAHYIQHDDSFLERFLQEVQIVAQLQHPHILPVHDFGEQDGLPYIVMAYLSRTLGDRIRESSSGLPIYETVRLVEQIAAGLDYAHEKGIIHRDLKPGNVLMDEKGNAYLADFGIAKVIESTAQWTGSGVVGTPAYMAPEMADPAEPTPLVDIYALGVTLFQMLTGRLPYAAATTMGVLMAHVSRPIPDVRALRPNLPARTQSVIERGMAKNPRDRYQHAGELSAALSKILLDTPPVDILVDDPFTEPLTPEERDARATPAVPPGPGTPTPVRGVPFLAKEEEPTPREVPKHIRWPRVPAWVWIIVGVAAIAVTTILGLALAGIFGR
jgi:serine/threonine-protein kinase